MKRLIVSMLLTVLLLSGCQTSPQSYSETQFLLDTVCTIQAGGPDAKAAVQAAYTRIREDYDAEDYYTDTSTVAPYNRAAAAGRPCRWTRTPPRCWIRRWQSAGPPAGRLM